MIQTTDDWFIRVAVIEKHLAVADQQYYYHTELKLKMENDNHHNMSFFVYNRVGLST